MFTPSRGCFHDAAQLMRRAILCSQPHGVQPRQTRHIFIMRAHEKTQSGQSVSCMSNNNKVNIRNIIHGRGKILSYFPPHSCLIVSDKSGNGECDIVKYFHSISVKYFTFPNPNYLMQAAEYSKMCHRMWLVRV